MKKIVQKSERIVYIKKCPICSKDIKGYSENQTIYNLNLHMEAHNEKQE